MNVSIYFFLKYIKENQNIGSNFCIKTLIIQYIYIFSYRTNSSSASLITTRWKIRSLKLSTTASFRRTSKLLHKETHIENKSPSVGYRVLQFGGAGYIREGVQKYTTVLKWAFSAPQCGLQGSPKGCVRAIHKMPVIPRDLQ